MWFLIPIGIALYLLTRHPDDTYTDRNGVEWKVWYSSHYDSWFVTDVNLRYETPAWSVMSIDGTKAGAGEAAEFYAQEHKPIS